MKQTNIGFFDDNKNNQNNNNNNNNNNEEEVMNMNEIVKANDGNVDIAKLMKLMEKNAIISNQNVLSVQGMSQQLGILNQQLGIVATDVTNLRGSYNNLENRMEQIELNEEVTTDMLDSIHLSVNNRIADILKNNSLDYAKYSRSLFARLWTEARIAKCVAKPVAKTKKRDFQKAIDYIEAWIPNGGIYNFKKQIDEKAKAKKQARDEGYDC